MLGGNPHLCVPKAHILHKAGQTEQQMENHQRAEIDRLSRHYRTSFEPSVEDGLARLHARMEAPAETRPANSISGLLRIAAALALLLAATAVWKFGFSTDKNVFAAQDQVRSVSLPDGSEVLLNHYAKLQLSEGFNEENRLVQLSGEAYFKVAHDPLNPFIIDNGQTQVRVVGTAFNLSQSEDGLVVEVSEGKVELSFNREKLELGPHQCGMIQGNKMSMMEAPHLNRHAWRTGRLIFQDTPFEEVLSSIARAFRLEWDMQLVADHNCGNLLFNAQFDQVPLEEVLTAIERHYGLQIVPVSGQDRRYRISGGCR